MRFLDSGNILTQRHVAEIPVGQYSAFFIYIAGTNNAAQTVALSNMNNIRINRNGQDFVNADIENLSSLSDLWAGLIASASAVGAAFEFGFHIPFSFSDDFENVLTVADEDNVKVHFDFGNLTVPVLSGTWELYGILKSGIEHYLPLMVQDSVALAAAGNQEKRKAAINNIYDLYAFPSTAANFARLTVERDAEVLSDAQYNAQQVYTNLSHKKEGTAIEVACSEVALGARPDELLSESIYVTPLSQTGALTVEFVYRGAQFQKDAIQASQSVVNTRINRNVAVKTTVGKEAEVSAATLERIRRAEERYGK